LKVLVSLLLRYCPSLYVVRDGCRTIEPVPLKFVDDTTPLLNEGQNFSCDGRISGAAPYEIVKSLAALPWLRDS
jgi:hypothetical protein